MNRGIPWQSVRQEYLKAVYELGELKDRNGVPPAEVLGALGLSEEEGDQALDFLVESGMIVWPAKGELLLTEAGMDKAQELERAPTVVSSSQRVRAPFRYRRHRLSPVLGRVRTARTGEVR